MCFLLYFLSLKRVKRRLDVSAIKMLSVLQVCHRKSFFDLLFRTARQLLYFFSDWFCDFKAWQVKYSTCMLKGAGIAV